MEKKHYTGAETIQALTSIIQEMQARAGGGIRHTGYARVRGRDLHLVPPHGTDPRRIEG